MNDGVVATLNIGAPEDGYMIVNGAVTLQLFNGAAFGGCDLLHVQPGIGRGPRVFSSPDFYVPFSTTAGFEVAKGQNTFRLRYQKYYDADKDFKSYRADITAIFSEQRL